MTPEETRLLYDYNAWANHRVLGCCDALTGEQFTRGLGSSFGSVRDTLAHILGGEWIWLERFLGRSPSQLPVAGDFPNLASLRQRWSVVEQNLLRFVKGLSAEDLTRVEEYRTIDGTAYAQPLWQPMQHLVNHGTYHRGQVTTLLRQLGATPVSTDLIRFYRDRAAGKSA
jgi:uncharacterized damage-inducible protein DinB